MNCPICGRPAPVDQDAMIDEGWIPYFYAGLQEIPGPVCPQCRERHLRLGDDGEWSTILPHPDAHLWN